jgi:hypothetical protein
MFGHVSPFSIGPKSNLFLRNLKRLKKFENRFQKPDNYENYSYDQCDVDQPAQAKGKKSQQPKY